MEHDMPIIGGNLCDLTSPEPTEQVVEREPESAVHAADDDSFQATSSSCLAIFRIQAVQIQGDHDRRFRVLDLARDLALGIERVEVNNGAPALRTP
jgi:hypothetical protein